MPKATCISIKEDTHKRLILIGHKNESFDDIVKMLLDEHDLHNVKKWSHGV